MPALIVPLDQTITGIAVASLVLQGDFPWTSPGHAGIPSGDGGADIVSTPTGMAGERQTGLPPI